MELRVAAVLGLWKTLEQAGRPKFKFYLQVQALPFPGCVFREKLPPVYKHLFL